MKVSVLVNGKGTKKRIALLMVSLVKKNKFFKISLAKMIYKGIKALKHGMTTTFSHIPDASDPLYYHYSCTLKSKGKYQVLIDIG